MVVLLTAIALFAVACSGGDGSDQAATTTVPADGSTATTPTTTPPTTPKKIDTIPGMPPVPDPSNLYSETKTDNFAPATKGALTRVYVPNRAGNTVSVIDPATMKVVDTFDVGLNPQHVVPSNDLTTLWVTNNAEGRTDGSLTPIDPQTGKPGTAIPVDDPYNMYFTPDGKSAIVVAEAFKRLDFRDPHTMELTGSLEVPGCSGINHADYDGSGTYILATCEFAGKIAKIDMTTRTVVGLLDLAANPVAGQPPAMPMEMPNGDVASYMPQDVRAGPDGKHFYVADMLAGGVFVLDGDLFTVTQFIPTGIGAHGITPSRDASRLYIANRGSNSVFGMFHGPGSVSVLDIATNTVVATWDVPDGGSPDMGNLNAAGTELWLAGRFDSEVYVFDTVNGGLVARIPVGEGPHGLTVWPQPGRFSLGHTGNMR
jgi:YVTN family beta-propeller protein